MEKSLIARIQSELLEMADEDYKESVKNYFPTNPRSGGTGLSISGFDRESPKPVQFA